MRLVCALILFALSTPLTAQIEGKVPGLGTKLDCIVIADGYSTNPVRLCVATGDIHDLPAFVEGRI